MTRALVLSGGGGKGAFEVGALQQLIHQQQLDFDLFCGTSVGAINAAFLAQGASWSEQAEGIQTLAAKWFTLSGSRDIYRRNRFGLLNLLFGGALFSPVGLKRLIHSLIRPEKLRTGKRLMIPAVALEDGELYYADSGKEADCLEMERFVLASASIPVYFPPVIIRGKHWVDGGTRDLTPLSVVVKEAPQEIVVITTYPINSDLEPIFPPFRQFNNTLAIVKRILDILNAEIGSNDLRVVNKVNQRMSMLPRPQNTRIILVAPKQPLPTGGLSFSPKLIREYFQHGQQAAVSPRVFR
ncbi:NTE family protein [Hydrogenispora ethanolica]|uniref:NTE family protein n=1 Tax=Hydrogenispora ethanolica TaxID=1082276 RepID=A0A4R1RY63_HYDET|nr:patatin-like phospholipase family protein [Hydrogenispora ethanolica]TCL70922.1 NTE family protein [Hydrogenispora ethanolica]